MVDSDDLIDLPPDQGQLDVVAVGAATIVRVKVERLFGLYTYELPQEPREFDRTPIIYGENGLGKTSILRLLFHLLSPVGDRGHRTFMSQVKFGRIEVYLSNDVTVAAYRQGDALLGAVRLEVKKFGDLLGAWSWFPKETPPWERAAAFQGAALPDVRATSQMVLSQKAYEEAVFDLMRREANPREGERAFLNALRENVPPIYILSADRVLSSDTMPRDLAQRGRPIEDMSEARGRALRDAVRLAARHLVRLGVQATRQGSMSVHTIYQDLMRRLLSSAARGKGKKSPKIHTLIQTLRSLSAPYEVYAKYGLAPELDAEKLIGLLDAGKPSARASAAKVLAPYVESLTRQSKSIQYAYSVIDNLVSTTNTFLLDKRLEFSMVDGLVIKNKLDVVLRPTDLSSGEQQLYLLFCHVIVTHRSGGIFIIDEPEISLNVRWQRRLVDALLRLDVQKNLQFVFASHSIEILSKHRDSVVPLRENA